MGGVAALLRSLTSVYEFGIFRTPRSWTCAFRLGNEVWPPNWKAGVAQSLRFGASRSTTRSSRKGGCGFSRSGRIGYSTWRIFLEVASPAMAGSDQSPSKGAGQALEN